MIATPSGQPLKAALSRLHSNVEFAIVDASVKSAVLEVVVAGGPVGIDVSGSVTLFGFAIVNCWSEPQTVVPPFGV